MIHPGETEEMARHALSSLDYDPATGFITWKQTRDKRSRRRPGAEAGWMNKDGYRRLELGGRQFLAHRVAFLLMTGKWPPVGIDHKNGLPGDNRWDNLREATQAENCQNRSSKGGRVGATFYKPKNKWRARIMVGGRNYDLGLYTTHTEAYAAYLAAKARFHQFQPIPRENR